jgi:Zn-dependent protease with chaperone function
MTAAVYLMLYGALVTWLAPPLLSRLTRRGVDPRLGVAAWLTAIVGVLVAWTTAVATVIVGSVVQFPDSPVIVVCLELLGLPARVAEPGWLALLVIITTAVALSVALTVKASASALSLRGRSLDHAHAARIIGEPTGRRDVFVVTADRPAAYCVAGRPHAIVITSAAVDRLEDVELDAVIAHEDAHLAGRHHQLLMVLRALAAALPWLPLFPRGADAVADLVEMCADDTAVREHDCRSLVTGMVKLAGPVPRPAGLAVAAGAVAVRAGRLLDPACGATVLGHRLVASAVIGALAGAPVVITLICRH